MFVDIPCQAQEHEVGEEMRSPDAGSNYCLVEPLQSVIQTFRRYIHLATLYSGCSPHH